MASAASKAQSPWNSPLNSSRTAFLRFRRAGDSDRPGLRPLPPDRGRRALCAELPAVRKYQGLSVIPVQRSPNLEHRDLDLSTRVRGRQRRRAHLLQRDRNSRRIEPHYWDAPRVQRVEQRIADFCGGRKQSQLPEAPLFLGRRVDGGVSQLTRLGRSRLASLVGGRRLDGCTDAQGVRMFASRVIGEALDTSVEPRGS